MEAWNPNGDRPHQAAQPRPLRSSPGKQQTRPGLWQNWRQALIEAAVILGIVAIMLMLVAVATVVLFPMPWTLPIPFP